MTDEDLLIGERFRDIKHPNIIYMDTHEVTSFFESGGPSKECVLVTHNSDAKVTDSPRGNYNPAKFDADVRLMPDNIKLWYSQNVCFSHDRIKSLPIGLENKMWFPNVKKHRKILERGSRSHVNNKLLYVNHNVRTNVAERGRPYEIFGGKTWATLRHGGNGSGFDQYLDDISTHSFVLCPEGNGTDTHRTWETLYVGGIPIEKRNVNNQFYNELPICFVDSWDEITEEFLIKEKKRIDNTAYNLDMLTMSYWRDIILRSAE